MRNNPDHRYGDQTDLATKKAPTIAKIVNNDYFKEFLTDKIASKAIEAATKRNNRLGFGKGGRNRPFKMRSGSVIA